MKRNVCGPILTCGGVPVKALTWGFLVGMHWLPTAVHWCPADWLRTGRGAGGEILAHRLGLQGDCRSRGGLYRQCGLASRHRLARLDCHLPLREMVRRFHRRTVTKVRDQPRDGLWGLCRDGVQERAPVRLHPLDHLRAYRIVLDKKRSLRHGVEDHAESHRRSKGDPPILGTIPDAVILVHLVHTWPVMSIGHRRPPSSAGTQTLIPGRPQAPRELMRASRLPEMSYRWVADERPRWMNFAQSSSRSIKSSASSQSMKRQDPSVRSTAIGRFPPSCMSSCPWSR